MLPDKSEARLLDSVRVVAANGQPAPGRPAGNVFTGFARPVINNGGRIAFGAQITDPTVPGSNRLGIWTEEAGQLNLVALHGVHPPGASLLLPPSPGNMSFALDDLGRVVFPGPIRDEDGRSIGGGLWAASQDSLELIVPIHEPMEFNGALVEFALARPSINRHGILALNGTYAPYQEAIWILASNELSKVADTADHLPGTPPHSFFTELSLRPLINASARTAFLAWTTLLDSMGIWSNAHGELELVALAPSPAPGFGAGVQFGSFVPHVINARGDVVFSSDLIGEGTTLANNESLWIWRDSQLRTIAREGDEAPGLPGVMFDSFFGQIWRSVSSDTGDVAFLSRLRAEDIDPNVNFGIWRDREDELQLIARTGAEAPGMDSGVVFAQLEAPVISHAGQLAFVASLTGPNIDFRNDWGVWAEDVFGNLRLIVQEGDVVDLDPGRDEVLRTISQIDLLAGNLLAGYHARGEGDQPYAFNNRGQIAFQVTFTDGQQAILVSNLLVIPEPATSTLAALCLIQVATWNARSASSTRNRINRHNHNRQAACGFAHSGA
jgi:hypothetical protein